MSAPGQVVPIAARLRETLERLAEALARPSLDGLLACEAALERALADLLQVKAVAPAARALLGIELDRARQMLRLCRRLGTGLSEFARASFEAQGRGAGYGPRLGAAASYAGRSLNTSV